MKAKVNTKLNVSYVVKDKDGNAKPLFQPNSFYTKAMKLGILSPFAYQKLGSLNFVLGNWSNALSISNLITTAGKALVAGRINGSGSPAAATYIAVGTGTTAANVADTTLETEISDSGLARANGTVSLVTTDTTNDTARVTYTFSVSGTKAVTEAGLLNAASTGTLLARQVFSAVNVVSGDSLQVTWDIDVD